MSYSPSTGGNPAWGDVTGKPSVFPPDTHTHVEGDVTGLTAALGGKAASSHSHAQSEVTNLVTDLAGKAASVHTHAAADIVSGTMATARLGSGTPDGTKYLRDDSTWATPPAGGGTWTTVKATNDQSKTDNALAASTYLTIALSAATNYVIRGTVWLLVQNANADARYSLNYSGTWTTVYCRDSRNVAGVAAGTDAVTDRIASALPGSTDVLATVTGIVIVEFELCGLTNASGTFDFRFAQVTNNASATILKRGSYLEHMTV